MNVNLDSVAIGRRIRIGGEIYKKVSPMICQSLKTGQLLYDARLIPKFSNVEAPTVQYIG